MAVFGPNQKEELLIGNALAGDANVAEFISTAVNREIGVYSKNGGAVAANAPFYVLQKTDGDASKGLNYEFSKGIDPKYVTDITLHEYKAATEKTVRVNGFTGTPQANATYQVSIRLYNDGGTLSVENFRHIHGIWVTNDDVTVENTNTKIIAGLVDSLNRAQAKEGIKFSVTPGATFIDIAALSTSGNPIQDIAKQIEFDVQVSVKSNGIDSDTASPESYPILSADITAVANPGVGTGKYLSNLETFTRGYNYEVYRGASYPANFNQPALYSDYNGKYHIVHIKYYYKHSVAGVEEQPAVLTVAFDAAAGVSGTNAFLGALRTAVGTANVPANLE